MKEKGLLDRPVSDSTEYRFEREYFFQQSWGVGFLFLGGFNGPIFESPGVHLSYSPKWVCQFHEFGSVCAGTNLQAFYNPDRDVWGITIPLTIGASAGNGAGKERDYDYIGDDPVFGGFLNMGPGTSLRAYVESGEPENFFGFYVDGGIRFYKLEIRSSLFKPFKKPGYTFDLGIVIGSF
jgi:hypothetical protein